MPQSVKCNPYSETTVESRTHLITVKITSNIFAVYLMNNQLIPVLLEAGLSLGMLESLTDFTISKKAVVLGK